MAKLKEAEVSWINEGLTKPGKSKAGLALAMGVHPSSVSRLISGERQLKAREVDAVRNYLNAPEPSLQDLQTASHSVPVPTTEKMGVFRMGEPDEQGWSTWTGQVLQYTLRPSNLRDVVGAYGVFITRPDMAPRYSIGDIAHINPARPATPGCYTLVLRKPLVAGGEARAVIKRMVSMTSDRVRLEQLEPFASFDIHANEVLAMHRIVGSSEA